MPVRVTFLGSGDAFGSGGRFQACILVEGGGSKLLLDCGASSLIAMRRFGIEPNGVDAVLLSHLHGDHFGGVPFMVLDAQLVSRRSRPLVVAGPPGTPGRVAEAMEVLFPGSSQVERKFPLELVELAPGATRAFGDFVVTPSVVRHASGAPPFALRIECEERIIAYTGDTEWTDTLVEAARGADLLIAEAYFFEKRVRFHLDYTTLARALPGIDAKRVILTHMSQDMLSRLAEVACETAEDGKTVTV